jgi:hypothetical protein
MLRIKILISVIFIGVLTNAQIYSGLTLNKREKTPVSYVNIGIINRNTGTTSNADGSFEIGLNDQFNNDTLRFSCIGYESVDMRVADFKKLKYQVILFTKKTYKLRETVVIPRRYKEKIQGITAKSKKISAGFTNNLLGYEMGVMMYVSKSARLKSINLNISYCDYDTIFYRINVYEVNDKSKMVFENILRTPIYFKIAKNKIRKTITLDVEDKYIWVTGKYLITIEYVKDLGKGKLWFCSGIGHKTYFRKTSQGKWETAPIGIGMNVVADVEY